MTWWQIICYILAGIFGLWCVLKIIADAVFGTYFDKKAQFIGSVAGVAAKAAEQFTKVVKKNDQT